MVVILMQSEPFLIGDFNQLGPISWPHDWLARNQREVMKFSGENEALGCVLFVYLFIIDADISG